MALVLIGRAVKPDGVICATEITCMRALLSTPSSSRATIRDIVQMFQIIYLPSIFSDYGKRRIGIY